MAALEAFLATSLSAGFMPYRPQLQIKVHTTDFLAKPIEWSIDAETGGVEVRLTSDESVGIDKLRAQLPELLIAIMSQLVMVADFAHLESLFRDELAMDRAMNLSQVGTCVGNLLGSEPKLRLEDWTIFDGEQFPVNRTQQWNWGIPSSSSPPMRDAPVSGSGDPPAELLNPERLKHRDP